METVTGAGRWLAALKPEEAEGAASSFAKLLSNPDAHQPPGIDKPQPISPLPCRAGRVKDAMADSMAAASADGGSSPSNAGRIGTDGWPESAGPSPAIQQDAFPSVDDESERNRRDWFSGRLGKDNRLESGPNFRAAFGEFPPPVWLPPLPQRLSQYHRHGEGGTTRAAAPESRSSARAETSVSVDLPRARVEPSRSSPSKTVLAGGRAAAPSQSPTAAMASRQTSAPPLSDAARLETGSERRDAGRSPSAAAIRSSLARTWPEARREDSLPAAVALFPPADGKITAASPSSAAAIGMAAGVPANPPTDVARHAGHVSGQGAPGAAGSANAGIPREPAVPASDNSSRIKLASASTGLMSPGAAGDAAANPLSGPPGRSRKQHEDAAAAMAAGRQDAPAPAPAQPMAASDGASAPRPRNWTDGTPQSSPQSEPGQASGIGYRFLRWGGEHAVRIQSRNGRLSLQPSDSLVQQRLSEQWPSGNPQYWILDRDGGERQSPRQASDECEEEG
ncbi:type III secretion system needle length determinant, SpaN/EivJ family [Chromobacterium piscinae]|uniref:SpaN/EivJ family type III secretion system needle length determinant n=1 Tax=Chromobacterium piscinae TaxID=686831 RepID=UPI001E3ED27E|nr:type III secretion system needle length determinant, SpaN/EivJ family [Chromobacterium piscinae]MCD5328712.1 hypothetical protein [Chromobacterium piscinae]